jgi:hypothetical protein
LLRANGFEKTHDAARDFDELYDDIALHDAPRTSGLRFGTDRKSFLHIVQIPRAGWLPEGTASILQS